MLKVIVLFTVYQSQVTYHIPFYQTMKECQAAITVIKSRKPGAHARCIVTDVDTLAADGIKVQEI